MGVEMRQELIAGTIALLLVLQGCASKEQPSTPDDVDDLAGDSAGETTVPRTSTESSSSTSSDNDRVDSASWSAAVPEVVYRVPLEAETVNAIAYSDGVWVAGSPTGLQRYSADSGELELTVAGTFPDSLVSDGAGGVVGAFGGGFVWVNQDGMVQYVSVCDSGTASTVAASESTIWTACPDSYSVVGTDRETLTGTLGFVVDSPIMTSIRMTASENAVWIVANAFDNPALLQRFDTNDIDHILVRQVSPAITDIALSSDSTLWVSLGIQGVLQLDPQTLDTVLETDQFFSPAMEIEPDGDWLWASEGAAGSEIFAFSTQTGAAPDGTGRLRKSDQRVVTGIGLAASGNSAWTIASDEGGTELVRFAGG